MRNPHRFRILFLLLGAVSLLAGLCGGLWRLGWVAPHGATLGTLHGPLMVSGLFGTLISLERAVALGRPWAYLAPAFTGIGSLLLLLGFQDFAATAYLLASGVFSVASFLVLRQQPALFTGTLMFGALAWLYGNLLWLLGGAIPSLVGWWLAFLILTIAGERLEMSRLLPSKRGSEALFVLSLGLLAAGAQNGMAEVNGAILFGLGLLAGAAWLLRHDIARRTVRQIGQTRFFAICMLLGYAWLALGGVSLLLHAPSTTTLGYDIAIHSILIGFVISMVFGHALIILPAVMHWRVKYSPFLYGPLALLHASVLMRVTSGLADWPWSRQISGLLTVVAIIAFILTVAAASLRNGKSTKGNHVPVDHLSGMRPDSSMPTARS